MNTDMVMAALNQAITDRSNPKDVIHHSDRGVQYLSIRYTDKMTDSGVIDYLKQQWQGVNNVELATLEWVECFNKKRLHSTIGYVSPFEFERRYYDSLTESDKAA